MQMKKLQPSIWLGLIKPTSLDKLSKHCRCALFLKTKNERTMKLLPIFPDIYLPASSSIGSLIGSKAERLPIVIKPTNLFSFLRNTLDYKKAMRVLRLETRLSSLLNGDKGEGLRGEKLPLRKMLKKNVN